MRRALSSVSSFRPFSEVILHHASLRIQVGVRNDLFEKYITSLPVPERKFLVDNPYLLLFSQTILAMATFGDQLGIQGPCDFIFDEQKGFVDEALESWRTIKAQLATSKRSDLGNFIGSPPIFRDDKAFLPLQAADFYAWHMRQRWSRNQILIVPPTLLLRQFEKMPVISRVYDEGELKRLREHLQKGGEIFAANNPMIPLLHVGKSRSERKKIRRNTKGVLNRTVSSRKPS